MERIQLGNPSADRRSGDRPVLLLTTLKPRNRQPLDDRQRLGCRHAHGLVAIQRRQRRDLEHAGADHLTSQGIELAMVRHRPWPRHPTDAVRAHAGRIVVASDYDSLTGNGRARLLQRRSRRATCISAVSIDTSRSLNFNETTAVELTNGNIYFNSRDSGGSAPHHRSIAYSTDGGATTTGKGIASTLIDPVVQGSVQRYSAIDTGQSSNRLLFSNPADPSVRQSMTIRSSFDEKPQPGTLANWSIAICPATATW